MGVATLARESGLWRAGLLSACIATAIIASISIAEGTPLMPWSSTTLGLSVSNSEPSAGVTIVDIAKGGPADVAGLRVGDRIEFRDIGFDERWRLRVVFRTNDAYAGLAGEQLHIVVHRGSRVFAKTIPSQPRPPTWGSWGDWIQGCSCIWGLIFAAVLAARRPDLKEARLLSLMLLFMLGINGVTGTLLPWPAAEFWLQISASTCFLSVPIACLAMYAGLFGRPLSLSRKLLASATVAAALANAFWIVAINIYSVVLAVPVYALWSAWYLWSGGLALSLACALSAIVATRGNERQRLLWVTVSLAPIWIFYLLGLVWAGAPRQYTVLALTFGTAVMPIGFTYAVLSRRCVDIGYAINRAAVFGFVSIVVLGIFVLVEWALGTWLSSASHTTSLVVNLAIALVLGLSIRVIHRYIEGFVDRVFFRKRHENEVALRRFARDAPFITDLDVLTGRTKELVVQHAEAADAQVLLMDGKVDENDPAVLAMRATHDPVNLHRYDTKLAGELAFPACSRGQVLGILVCGAKRDGEAYAPDETEALTAVAHGVGSALDALGSARNGEQIELADLVHHMRVMQRQLTNIETRLNGHTRER